MNFSINKISFNINKIKNFIIIKIIINLKNAYKSFNFIIKK